MQKSKRISKLFVVVALVLTIALCCALFGCGEKVDRASDQDTSPIVTESENNSNEEQNGGDNSETAEPSDEEGKSFDDDLFFVPESPATNGFYIKGEFEEAEEYDITDVSMDVIYGVNVDLFNSMARGYSAHRYLEDCGIYFCAYNLGDYYYKQDGNKAEIFDHEKLYNNLKELDEWNVKDGVLLIDEIPHVFANGYMLGEELMFGDEQFLVLDNLKGTEYEADINDDPFAVTCYKRISVNFPRELFNADEGRICVNVFAYGSYCQDERNYVSTIGDSSGSTIQFDYAKNGDMIKLSNIRLGGQFVFDGTASLR